MIPFPLGEAVGAITTLIGIVNTSARTHFQNAESLAYRADIVRRWLWEIRQKPDWIAALGRNAYWHSNGFVKIKIAEAAGYCPAPHLAAW